MVESKPYGLVSKMASQTISLEVNTYEKLKEFKKTYGCESFTGAINILLQLQKVD